jgi:dUTP pyrophosphatase
MSTDQRNEVELKVKRLDLRAILPQYQTAGASCFDLHALLPEGESRTVCYREPVLFDTGLAFDLPEGWALEAYSRSGHGINSSVRLANGVGQIDQDFRGQVQVKLTADIGGGLTVRHGDRIAQVKIVPVYRAVFVEVNELSKTARGAGGFGSTGSAAALRAI